MGVPNHSLLVSDSPEFKLSHEHHTLLVESVGHRHVVVFHLFGMDKGFTPASISGFP